MGSFLPPQKIVVCTEFLKTLEQADVLSGVGEMIKVHMIAGADSFQEIEKDYDKILTDDSVMTDYIYKSLLIKKKLIEEDEFDRGIRNIMNYGHTFGHAIESATQFAIPHGLAVTIGMDMANYVAYKQGRWTIDDYKKHTDLLKRNSSDFYQFPIDVEKFLKAISKDKKNSATHMKLILPNQQGQIEKVPTENNKEFQTYCTEYLQEVRMT